MDLEYEQRGQRLIVRVAGELDLGGAATFRRRVDGWIDATRTRHVLLDLRRVTLVDSVGLGAILGRLRHLQRGGGSMAVLPPPGTARRVLEVGGLGSLAAFYTTEHDALAAWEASERGA